ncbi:MAG: shikimate kinase [Flavobacterium sp.]
MKKVVLIGYMGSGKSTVAQKLASQLGKVSLDLDELIEKKSGMIIETIFATKGEIYFRKLEHELFVEVLKDDNDVIISTGGGTPCYFNNHELLNSDHVVSIYLSASVENLYQRLIHEKQKRPLLANLDHTEIKEFIAKHLFDRSFYYNQATFKVLVDGKSVDDIAFEIKKLLA